MHNGFLKTSDEIKKAYHKLDGIPIVVNHPSGNSIESMKVMDKNKWVGVLKNPKLKRDEKSGEFYVEAEAHIFKKHEDIIEKIKKDKIKEVSLGFGCKEVYVKGTYNGQEYYGIDININPYHLALMDGFEAACPYPSCGIVDENHPYRFKNNDNSFSYVIKSNGKNNFRRILNENDFLMLENEMEFSKKER